MLRANIGDKTFKLLNGAKMVKTRYKEHQESGGKYKGFGLIKNIPSDSVKRIKPIFLEDASVKNCCHLVVSFNICRFCLHLDHSVQDCLTSFFKGPVPSGWYTYCKWLFWVVFFCAALISPYQPSFIPEKSPCWLFWWYIQQTGLFSVRSFTCPICLRRTLSVFHPLGGLPGYTPNI